MFMFLKMISMIVGFTILKMVTSLILKKLILPRLHVFQMKGLLILVYQMQHTNNMLYVQLSVVIAMMCDVRLVNTFLNCFLGI